MLGNEGDAFRIAVDDAVEWLDGDGDLANGIDSVATVTHADGQIFFIYRTNAGAQLYVDEDVRVVTE